jgi:cold shock CspA family protein
MELKVETRNLDMRNGWQEKIEEEREKLTRHYAGLVQHLRVTVESTSSHKEGGNEVRLVASVPQDTVVVKRKGEKVRHLLVEAFDVLGMQLKEMVRKKQSHKGAKGSSAVITENAAGVIKRFFPDEAYGFIISNDNREIFFHANALRDGSLSDISEGDTVSFAVSEGDKGPQASWFRLDK